MKRNLFLLVTIGMTSIIYGQDKSCEELKSIYFLELRGKNYQEASKYWQAAHSKCGVDGVFSEGFFSNGSVLYHTLAKQASDETLKAHYQDTLVEVYKSFYTNYPTPENAVQYAYYAAKYQDASGVDFDSHWNQVHELKEKALLHYLTGYMKYHVKAELEETTVSDQKSIELLEDYFLIRTYAQQSDADSGKIEKTVKNIDRYLLKSLRTKEQLARAMEVHLKNEDQTDWKRTHWEKRRDFFERFGLQDTPLYGAFLSGYTNTFPTYKRYADLADYYFSQGEEAQGEASYTEAFVLASSEEEKDTIRIKQVAQAYKKGSYRKAYRMAEQIKTSFLGEAKEYQAYCVAATANDCGNSTIERMANFYYAQELVQKARALGATTSQSYVSRFPDVQELHSASLSSGQKIQLECWNVSVTIP